jgi:uncharacterized membrane protein YvbJ
MKHCTNCGKGINNIDKFCAHCGSSINNDTIKVEITNATTEKVFKAVGDTISSGKQTATTGIKSTTGFVKKIAPIVVTVIVIFLAASLILGVDPENLWDFIFQGHKLRYK